MIRVSDVTPDHAVVVWCATCRREATIKPVRTEHLSDPSAPLATLGYRCLGCRKRAHVLRIEYGAKVVEVTEYVPDSVPPGWKPGKRMTTAARLDYEAHGLGGIGKVKK